MSTTTIGSSSFDRSHIPGSSLSSSITTTSIADTSSSLADPQLPTLATLLATHASAGNPLQAAAEAAISDRNALDAQNKQLWKLIEKQRIAYAKVSKDLDRIRAERDTLKAQIGLSSAVSRPSTANAAVPMSSLHFPPNDPSTPERRPLNGRQYSDTTTDQSNSTSLVPTKKTSQVDLKDDPPIKNTTPPPQIQISSRGLQPAVNEATVSRESRISIPGEAKRYLALNHSPQQSSSQPSPPSVRDHPPSPSSSSAPRSAKFTGNSPLSSAGSKPSFESAGPSTSAGAEFLDLEPEYNQSADDLVTDDQSPRKYQEDGSDSIQSSMQPKLRIGTTPSQTHLASTDSSTTATSPSFRALPLLATDLPHTTISVPSSSIRFNDRGKEVLSFLIQIEPGNGKDRWQVEKLYSDVLSLDSRLKALLPKTTAKKMGTLPDGKLWRDHAPAKIDQRKAALETYLQSLINLPVKNKDEVIAFFTSDIVRDTKKPVMQAGYKEGYLTKRGQKLGGWKTRYFVVHGPVLDYYENRGGTHLGSINITGAKIGRQQRSDRDKADDENVYRHAFLIIEPKRGGGSATRHVLCAESDADRDSWVDVLVKYVQGTYIDDPSALLDPGMSRTSISSVSTTGQDVQPVPPQPQPRRSRELTSSSSTQERRGISPARPELGFSDADNARRLLDRGDSYGEAGLSSSAPTSSPMDGGVFAARSNSEQGNYLDTNNVPRGPPAQLSPEREQRHWFRDRKAPGTAPTTLNMINHNPSSSDVGLNEASLPTPRAKISAPMGGSVLPSGFKFGPNSTAPPAATSQPKGRGFWPFGGTNDKSSISVNRAVFGVTIEESLEVAAIANLPAVVFRCIQYLEAKKADQEEGIYRLSGSSAVIKGLKDRFNTEGDVDLMQSSEYWDPHAIAGLLKTFLRDLPTSILTRELHPRFLSVIDFVDAQERIQELANLISALPLPNYSLLRALTAHLILIVQNSSVNKMTMRNVGIVFSPTLGIPAGVFSLMMSEFNRVFNVDEEEDESAVWDGRVVGVGEPVVSEHHDGTWRNSRQYSDAAADKLLGIAGRTLSIPESDGETVSSEYDSGVESVHTVDSEGPANDTSAAPNTPKSKASNPQGLKVEVSKRGNRHSRILGGGEGGLPPSPRPLDSPNRTNHTFR